MIETYSIVVTGH